jgi:hypothetical protein
LKIELPVRSAVLKQCTGGLVVRWVTTGEYPLLYVFDVFLLFWRIRGRRGKVEGDRVVFWKIRAVGREGGVDEGQETGLIY